MTNTEKLREVLANSGLKLSYVAKQLGCSRTRLYSIINGADCTASEIVTLTNIFHLSKAERDSIFLSAKVN